MITPLRHSLRLLPVIGLLLLAACQQMTAGALGGGAPLNATGDKTSSSSTTTDNGSSTDEPAPPPAAAPLPPPGGGDAGGLSGSGSGSTEYSTMMRRIPADGSSSGTAPDSVMVARGESGGGVLGAPSPGERLGDPGYELICNVRVVRLPVSAYVFPGASALKAKFVRDPESLDEDVLLPGATSRCDLRAIVESNPTSGQVTESQVKDDIPDLAPGYYLFYRSLTDHFDGEHVTTEGAPITSLDALATFLFDRNAKLIGEKIVNPPAAAPLNPAIVAPGTLQPLTPLQTTPTLRDGLIR